MLFGQMTANSSRSPHQSLQFSQGNLARQKYFCLCFCSVAECFAFLTCTKWYKPAIHRHSHVRAATSSSTTIRYIDWSSGLVVSSDEDHQHNRICNLRDIGGHIMKVPLVVFQFLFFMRLEGTPPSARHIPIIVLFSPILILQGAGVFFCCI